MNALDESAYAVLADELHAPRSVDNDGQTISGAEAAAEGQRLLMLATNQPTIDQAVGVALGRPRLDAAHIGPMWKVRATRALDEKVRSMASQMGITRSEFIRNAVAAYSL